MSKFLTVVPALFVFSTMAFASTDNTIDSILIDNIELNGYEKKSYHVVLQKREAAALSPYAFHGSSVQMKLVVELFHNKKNDRKAARIVTLGNGYIPGKPGVQHTYDSPLVDRFTQNYPTSFEYNIYQAGGVPIFNEDFSPQNETNDVSVSTTTVAPTIGLSLTSGENPSAAASLSSQLGVVYTNRYSSKDYVTAVTPDSSLDRGMGVKWTTSLSQIYTNDYQYYKKWAGVYHYDSCYNDNLIPEENFPRIIYGFTPKFQYVFSPSFERSAERKTTMVAKAGMKQVEEGFTRSACTWTDYSSESYYLEAQVRFTIDWDKLTVTQSE
ncbi:TPA: leukocidin family pore-forming toxin [Vibrio alginolyticus]|nr:hemolysin [Vibrio alginolyticus]